MSQDHAKSFLAEIDKNGDLYDEMSKIRDRMQADTIALAKNHGYEISPEEVKAALEEVIGGTLPGADEDGADPSTCFVPFSEAPGR